jgi:hypothetical protein
MFEIVGRGVGTLGAVYGNQTLWRVFLEITTVEEWWGFSMDGRSSW